MIRKLLTVLLDNIGINSDLQNLKSRAEFYFHFGHKWQCALVLDDASSLINRRTNHDVERNGKVAVFLRCLEYYGGMLFITTSGVGMIDEAYKSHIHMSLYLPPATKDSTLQMWEKYIENATTDHRIFISEDDHAKILQIAENNYDAGHTWDHRQIQNVIESAIGLA
ncbi:hypothetical protein BGZ60DRAFT_390670, partial [Tricladium varicosporioides]